MDAPHLGPAEDWLGMPVEKVIPTAHGAIVHHEMLYGPSKIGTPVSRPPKEATVADALAAFDAMASSHRAAAKQRAEKHGASAVIHEPTTTADGAGVASSFLTRPSPAANGSAPASASQCQANTGHGVRIRQCSRRAKPGSPYCGQHAKREAADDFEGAPLIADAPDPFTF